MGLKVQVLGSVALGTQGLGVGVQGFRVCGLTVWGESFGSRVQGLPFLGSLKVPELGFRVLWAGGGGGSGGGGGFPENSLALSTPETMLRAEGSGLGLGT